MARPSVRIYFDFVDPLSYLASHLLVTHARQRVGPTPEWVGFELRPPPAPLTASDDPIWTRRREAALPRAEEQSLILDPPSLVPWTRKAHELHVLAAGHRVDEEIRTAIFAAFFRDGRDIGRVDVLVEIATDLGLNRTETKAALDVDRYEADVEQARAEAVAAGVTDVPCYSVGGRLAEGFPDRADLGTLLPDES